MLSRIFASIAIAVAIVFCSINLSQNFYSHPLRVKYVSLSEDKKNEIKCLAENIYFEAAMEPTKGKIAVAFVTLNRVNSGRFPNTICGVVKQKDSSICQFSWYCEQNARNKVLTKSTNKLYNEIHDLATYFYVNHQNIDDPSKGALFYHADYVNPGWPNMIRTAVVGHHIFYQKRGFI